MYGFSLLVCLPDGMSSPPSAGTGTVMRPDTFAAPGRQNPQAGGLGVLVVAPTGFEPALPP